MQHVFKYKLDFYYQQTLIYLVTLVLYAGVRGSLAEGTFTFFYYDPLVYIIILFFLVSLTVLIMNRVRHRRLIITQDALVFKSHSRERTIGVSDIEWMHIGRERLVQTAGRFQLVILKVKGRRRVYRIRVGRYERSDELVAEMERLAASVPRRKHRAFGMQRRKPR